MKMELQLMRIRVEQAMLMKMSIRVLEDLSWCPFSFCFSPLAILDTECISKGNILVKAGERNLEVNHKKWNNLNKRNHNQEILKADRFLAKFQENLMNPTTEVFQPTSMAPTWPQRENSSPKPRKSQPTWNYQPKTSLQNLNRLTNRNQSTQQKSKWR